MKVEQETIHYVLKNGHKAILRVLHPSKPMGGWPGNKKVLREWKVFKPNTGNSVYESQNYSEMVDLEESLGSILISDWHAYRHPTLGMVLEKK